MYKVLLPFLLFGSLLIPAYSENIYQRNFIYTTDEYHVYFGDYEKHIVENADVHTFKVIKGFYAKDKNHIYYGGRLFPSNVGPISFEVDPVTFDVLGFGDGNYMKDKNHVYYTDYTANPIRIIKDADPATFVLCSGQAKQDTLLEVFPYCLSASFGVNPSLC